MSDDVPEAPDPIELRRIFIAERRSFMGPNASCPELDAMELMLARIEAWTVQRDDQGADDGS